MAMGKKIRLGDLLVQDGRITEAQLEKALAEQKRQGRKLGSTLVSLGYVSEEQMLESLARQLRIERVDLTKFETDPELVRKLPETQARRFRAIVLADRGDALLVGMADPTDIFAYDEIARLLKRPIKQAVVSERELIRVIDRMYRRTEEITSLAKELGQELSEGDYDIEQLTETHFRLTIRDNGPGIVRRQVEKVFGKLLYGSKFHRLRQSRGQQGIGISAAGMYGLLTTGRPVVVTSRISVEMAQTAPSLDEALKLAARAVSREDVIVVTGSFYLVGEARKYFRDKQAKDKSAKSKAGR